MASSAALSLAMGASEIGWNLLDATFRKDVTLLHGVMRELRGLLDRVEEINRYLREQPGLGVVALATNKPLKRLLATQSRERQSGIFLQIDPAARALRAYLDKAPASRDFPSDEWMSDLKLQVANLTGQLTKADI
jgi:hypothetical protein